MINISKEEENKEGKKGKIKGKKEERKGKKEGRGK